MWFEIQFLAFLEAQCYIDILWYEAYCVLSCSLIDVFENAGSMFLQNRRTSVTSRKTVIIIVTAMRTENVTFCGMLHHVSKRHFVVSHIITLKRTY